MKKLQSIENAFTSAHDWVNNTGQGVKETDGNAKFEECVRKPCKFCFELEPITADRAKARPKVTTDTIDDILDDEDDNDDEVEVSSISSSGASKVLQEASADGNTGNSSSRKRSRNPDSSQKKKTPSKAGNKSLSSERNNDPMVDCVKGRNSYFETKKNWIKDKHNWEMTKQSAEVMQTLLQTKESMEERGFSKEQIIKLVPSLVKVHDVLKGSEQ